MHSKNLFKLKNTLAGRLIFKFSCAVLALTPFKRFIIESEGFTVAFQAIIFSRAVALQIITRIVASYAIFYMIRGSSK